MNRIILSLLLLPLLIFAQSSAIKALEQQQNRYQKQILLEKTKLDSLNRELNTILAQIDSLNEQNASKNDISDLQAKSLSISKNVVASQTQIKALNKKIESVNKKLFKRYSRQIDSLNRVLSTEKDAQKREQITRELKLLTQKRIAVSPALKQFSFDPRKLFAINLRATKDSLKRAIIKDYIRNAINEVDTTLMNLNLKKQELINMKRLQEKAASFMDEVSDNQLYTSLPLKRGATGSFDLSAQSSGSRSLDAAATIEQLLTDLPDFNSFINQSMVAGDASKLDSVLTRIDATGKILSAYRAYLLEKLNQ
ncbi:MAG: hypothetical protein GXO77_02070 [Calditrichaeota bacterium]|nr:hypothetical protein [Calditrichota bacterium]